MKQQQPKKQKPQDYGFSMDITSILNAAVDKYYGRDHTPTAPVDLTQSDTVTPATFNDNQKQ